jgi:hypothetical protein
MPDLKARKTAKQGIFGNFSQAEANDDGRQLD